LSGRKEDAATESGAQYFGRYRADRLVGSGAFATVWLAEDETLAAPVAIKILAENWAHDEEVRQRFLEEARILWRADSDHIVRIHYVDQLEDGRPYFVMDYADRGTLHERMRERVQGGGQWSIDEAVALSLAIAEGLKVAHALGIVHRDLKPANIMFQSVPAHHGSERDEKLILTDFGMAKSVARSRGTTIATGTPYYMLPSRPRAARTSAATSTRPASSCTSYSPVASRIRTTRPGVCSPRRRRSRRPRSRRSDPTSRRRSPWPCSGV
jgi:serine/threonine protein kinase